MISVEQARELRAAMEKAAPSLDDQTASTAPEIFPRLQGDGALVAYGTRINWRGAVKRAKVDLWDTADNNPDNTPELWEDLEYRNGIRVIPAVILAVNPFAQGELGWWGDTLYRSILPTANTYTPEQYPAGWEVAE